MELELRRFLVQPVTAHRENGRDVDEEIGNPVQVFTVEQFAALLSGCEKEIEKRNRELADEPEVGE